MRDKLAGNAPDRLELDAGEHVLWEGAPPNGVLLRGGDLVVASLSVLGMVAMASAMARSGGSVGAPAMVTMVAMGAYMTVGRPFFDIWRRRRTQYRLTNQRLVIDSGTFRPTSTYMSLQNLPPMIVTEGRHGVGTIYFGETPLRWWRWSIGKYVPGMTSSIQFERIRDVRSVHQAILEAQCAYRV